MSSNDDRNKKTDMLPLVKPRHTDAAVSTRSNSNLRRCKWLAPFLTATVIAVLGAYFYEGARAQQSNPFNVLFKDCKVVCHSRSQQRIEEFGGDLLARKELLRLISEARDRAIQSLRFDYGEKYFSDIFEENIEGKSVIRKAFKPARNASTDLFKRKLQMKLLQVQAALRLQERDIEGCDCAAVPAPEKHLGAASRGSGGQRRRQKLRNNFTLPPLEGARGKFIWTTGGHSAAAGHGNLYNESYTAFMERAVKSVFAAAGIEFIGKNYAMGGLKSSPEIALCAEAIFGSDTDAVSWDFGMTDGGYMPWTFRMFLYNSRASLIPSRPALFGITVEEGDQVEIYSYFERNGIAGFFLNPKAEKEMRAGVPDCLGLSTEQLQALPPFVRNFKCDQKIENGDPFCDKEKYNDAICPDRLYKASWHPGWKAQALTGNAAALFLMDSLLEAAKDLALKSEAPEQLLQELQASEDADFKRLLNADLPDSLWGAYESKEYGDSVQYFAEVNKSVIFRSPALCHTALLPAETRFHGYLTESGNKGFWDYEKGLSLEEAYSKPLGEKDSSRFRLAFMKEGRQDCPVPINVDYKDFFYASNLYGWTTLTIPNDAEAKAYRYDSKKVHGIMIVRFGYEDWGHEEHYVNVDRILSGNASLEVNGVPVKDLVLFDSCYFLVGPGGFRWNPNSDGKFVLRARVNIENSYLKISSIIIL